MRNLKRNVVLLGIVLAMIVPVCSLGAPKTKSINKDSADLLPPAVDPLFPDADGKINIIEPNGNVELIINATMNGLAPNPLGYRVALYDKDGPFNPLDPDFFSALEVKDNGQAAWSYKEKADDIPIGDNTYLMYVEVLTTSGYVPVLISTEFGIGIE